MHTDIKRQSWGRSFSPIPRFPSIGFAWGGGGRHSFGPVQHLKATIPLYKMSRKERRHGNTNPPWGGGGLTAAVFARGRRESRVDEAAGLLSAADGLLTTCDVRKGAEIYIVWFFLRSAFEFSSDLFWFSQRSSSPGDNAGLQVKARTRAHLKPH